MKKAALMAALVMMLALLTAGCGKEDPYQNVPNPLATITLEDDREIHLEL